MYSVRFNISSWAISFLLCLPIIMLPMTLTWTNGSCIVSGLLCLIIPILLPKSKEIVLEGEKYLHYLVLFVLLHQFRTEDAYQSMIHTVYYLCYYVYFIYLLRVFIVYPDLKSKCLLAAASSFIYPIVGFIHMWLTVDNLNDLSWTGLMPGFKNVRFSAHLAYACLLICMYFMLHANRLSKTMFWGFSSSLIMGYMLFGGSRGPLLALLCYSSIILLWQKTKRKRFIVYLIIIFVGGIAFSSLFPVDRDAYSRMYSSLNRDDANSISSGRLEIWGDGVKLISEKPLLGHCVNTFRHHTHRGDRMCHPHNTIVQIGHDYGIVGLSVLAFLGACYLSVLRKQQKSQSIETEDIFYASFLISYFIYSLFTGISYYALPLFIIVLFTALSLSRFNLAVDNMILRNKTSELSIERVLLAYALLILVTAEWFCEIV